MRATLPNLIGESFLGQNEGSTWSGLRPRATPVGDPNGLGLRLQGRVPMDDSRSWHRSTTRVWFVIVRNAVLDLTRLFGLREA